MVATLPEIIKAETNEIGPFRSHTIQDVTGETDQTSEECSLGQTIPI